jgi:hypothetical protein
VFTLRENWRERREEFRNLGYYNFVFAAGLEIRVPVDNADEFVAFMQSREFRSEIDGIKAMIEQDQLILEQVLNTSYCVLMELNIEQKIKLLDRIYRSNISSSDAYNAQATVLKIIEGFDLQSDQKKLLEFLTPTMIMKFVRMHRSDNMQFRLINTLSNYRLNDESIGTPEQLVGQQFFVHPDNPRRQSVFDWQTNIQYSAGFNSQNQIQISSRSGMLGHNQQFFPGLDPMDYVVVRFIDGNRSFEKGSLVIMTALEFYWIVLERESERRWEEFRGGINIALNVGTLGIYGRVRTVTQIATQVSIATSMDYTIRLGINLLGDVTFEQAVAQTQLSESVWAGISGIIDNSRMQMALDCARELTLSVFDGNINAGLRNCVINTMISMITSSLFPNNGRYADLLREKFRTQPRIVIAKLREWGITDDYILSLTQTVTGSTINEIYREVNRIINNNEEER